MTKKNDKTKNSITTLSPELSQAVIYGAITEIGEYFYDQEIIFSGVPSYETSIAHDFIDYNKAKAEIINAYHERNYLHCKAMLALTFQGVNPNKVIKIAELIGAVNLKTLNFAIDNCIALADDFGVEDVERCLDDNNLTREKLLDIYIKKYDPRNNEVFGTSHRTEVRYGPAAVAKIALSQQAKQKNKRK